MLVAPPTTTTAVPVPVAAPVVVLPTASPTVTFPEAEPPATTAAPVTAQGEAAVQAAPTSTSTRTRAPVSAAPTTSAAASAPGPDGAAMGGMTPLPEVGTDLSEGPVPVAEPMADPASAAEPGQTDDSDVPVGMIAGLLAAFGIGAAGFAAMRSRRRHEVEAADTAVTPTTASGYQPVPVTSEPARVYAAVERTVEPPVQLGDDRERLLGRMVAAEPDSANPFRSAKARRKRARVILQHRDHLHSKGEAFDWRTYKPATSPESTAETTGREQMVTPQPALV